MLAFLAFPGNAAESTPPTRRPACVPPAALQDRPAGRHLRGALSVLLFVASVEAAWHAQRRLVRPLPLFAQRMAAPAQLGMRVARAAVWSAALVLAAASSCCCSPAWAPPALRAGGRPRG